MTFEKWGVFAEIVSSIAIVATLVYLAVQSQQTNSMLLGGSRQAVMEADLAFLAIAASNPDALSNILGDGALDGATAEDVLLAAYVRSREFAWFQYRNGVMDEEAFRSYTSGMATLLNGEIGQHWWGSRSTSLDPDFRDFVNEQIEIFRAAD